MINDMIEILKMLNQTQYVKATGGFDILLQMHVKGLTRSFGEDI